MGAREDTKERRREDLGEKKEREDKREKRKKVNTRKRNRQREETKHLERREKREKILLKFNFVEQEDDKVKKENN